MYLDGRGLRHRDGRGRLIMDDSFLLLLHAGDNAVSWTLPGPPWADWYEPVLDTARPGGAPAVGVRLDGETRLGARSVLLLRVARRAG